MKKKKVLRKLNKLAFKKFHYNTHVFSLYTFIDVFIKKNAHIMAFHWCFKKNIYILLNILQNKI